MGRSYVAEYVVVRMYDKNVCKHVPRKGHRTPLIGFALLFHLSVEGFPR
jgi:hypothetical protein